MLRDDYNHLTNRANPLTLCGFPHTIMIRRQRLHEIDPIGTFVLYEFIGLDTILHYIIEGGHLHEHTCYYISRTTA